MSIYIDEPNRTMDTFISKYYLDPTYATKDQITVINLNQASVPAIREQLETKQSQRQLKQYEQSRKFSLLLKNKLCKTYIKEMNQKLEFRMLSKKDRTLKQEAFDVSNELETKRELDFKSLMNIQTMQPLNAHQGTITIKSTQKEKDQAFFITDHMLNKNKSDFIKKKNEMDQKMMTFYKIYEYDKYNIYNNVEFVSFERNKKKPKLINSSKMKYNETLSKLHKKYINIEFEKSKDLFSYEKSQSIKHKSTLEIDEDEDFLFQLSHQLSMFEYPRKKKGLNFVSDPLIKKGLTQSNFFSLDNKHRSANLPLLTVVTQQTKQQMKNSKSRIMKNDKSSSHHHSKSNNYGMNYLNRKVVTNARSHSSSANSIKNSVRAPKIKQKFDLVEKVSKHSKSSLRHQAIPTLSNTGGATDSIKNTKLLQTDIKLNSINTNRTGQSKSSKMPAINKDGKQTLPETKYDTSYFMTKSKPKGEFALTNRLNRRDEIRDEEMKQKCDKFFMKHYSKKDKKIMKLTNTES